MFGFLKSFPGVLVNFLVNPSVLVDNFSKNLVLRFPGHGHIYIYICMIYMYTHKSSKADSRVFGSVLCKQIGVNNSGLMIEFRLLVGIGRSGVMIGRMCLDMVS